MTYEQLIQSLEDDPHDSELPAILLGPFSCREEPSGAELDPLSRCINELLIDSHRGDINRSQMLSLHWRFGSITNLNLGTTKLDKTRMKNHSASIATALELPANFKGTRRCHINRGRVETVTY